MSDPQEVDANLVNDAVEIASFSATVYRRLPPDHPVHNLVGRVAAGWALVEHMQDAIIWSLMKTDDKTGACVTPNHWIAPTHTDHSRAMSTVCVP
jgi:hypothetical protein